MTASAASADPAEQIVNGTFDAGTDAVVGTGNAPAAVVDGRLCADVPGGTVNPWDAIIGQNNIPLVGRRDVHATRFTAIGEPGRSPSGRSSSCPSPRTPSTLRGSPALTADAAAPSPTPSPRRLDRPTRQVAFQIGGSADAVDVLPGRRLAARAAPRRRSTCPDTGPRVRVNQVGYLPDGPEERHRGHRGDRPRCRGSCSNAAGDRRRQRQDHARAAWTPRSGQNVHTIDFGAYTTAGHRLHARRRRRDQPPVRHRRRPPTSSCAPTR